MFDLNTAILCFNIAGLTLSLAVLWLMYRRLSVNHVFVRALLGTVLQIAALCVRIYLALDDGNVSDGRFIAYRICIIGAHILSVVVVATSVLYFGNDRNTDSRNRESFNPFMIGAIVLPIIVSVACNNLWRIESSGFASSVSMLIVCEYLEAQCQRDLNYREQSVQLRQAKIMSEQMKPHFIYNSLMSIQYLIHTDPEAAADCLNDFSGYLRGSIDAITSDKPIPFKTELEHIRQFVKLEKAGSTYDFKIETDFETEDFMIPALTVQPIVENAVKHGALSRKDGTGTVRVVTRLAGQYIQIIVEDNGIPISMTERETEHRSVGIENVRTRLSAQCEGALTIKHTDTGTIAIITVPKEVV